MTASFLLSDADLHGLVDGHVHPDRRADLLRRAAASSRDRLLIEAWQDQNETIRGAFAGVDLEPLPSALDLRPPLRLHAVPRIAPPATTRPNGLGRRRLGLAAAVIALAVGSIVLSLHYARPVEVAASSDGKSGDERALIDRAKSTLALLFDDAAPPFAVAEPPALGSIPDLSAAGFSFTGADARGASTRSLVFHYRNAQDERVALGVARSEQLDSPPLYRDGGVTWRAAHVAYALVGTVAPERLRTLALSLNVDAKPE